LSFQEKNNNTFKFVLSGNYTSNEKVIIHQIDKKRGIAVFELSGGKREKFYLLMIDAKKVENSH
jgi:hypothetical protein